MRLYPDHQRLRTTTIAVDLACLAAVAVFAWLGTVVHDAVEELTAVSSGVTAVGTSVEGAFRDAGDAVGGAPVVGDTVQDALRDAGRGTGGQAAEAGRAGDREIGELASLLGWLTFLAPTALLLSRALPPRVAQVRRLTAAHLVVHDETGDPERRRLLAQRAAFGLPYAALVRHTRDPFGDLQAGRLDGLIAAVREDAGLRPRR